MSARLVSFLAAGAVLCLSGPVALAQQSSTEQVQQALQSSPDLVAKLRDRLASSGLSNDQIRGRLRAAGYPDTLLDAYLPGADSSKVAGATDPAAALRAVEVADSVAQAAAQPKLRSDTMERPDTTAIFGLDVFRRTTTQFDAASSGPVDPNYRVGPHDVLALILTGGVEAAYTLEISPEGFVVIPQVGQVYVANLTLGELNELLYTRLGAVYSGVRRGPGGSTRFSLTVARVRTNQIFVIGNVAVPGSYQVSSAGTILTALYAAGGPSTTGSLRNIEVRRAGQTVVSLDLYDYLINGDASHDSRLQSGDVVFVPFHGRYVEISGEVGRAMMYELRNDETLADLVRFAGGFTPTAATARIRIRRVLPPAQRTSPGLDRVVLDVPEAATDSGAPAFPLQAGDKVQVLQVAEVERNRITVTGNVWAPGELGYRPGMLLSEALRGAGDVKPDTYLGQVLIARLMPDGSRVQLRAQLADTTGRALDDVRLLENDSITVFSRSDFRPDRYIEVAGAVRSAGQIPYREGMTLRDAVLLAGGLTEGAYLGSAEIARMARDRSGGHLADTLRVSLDSSYLFDRGAASTHSGASGEASHDGAPITNATLEPYDQILILNQPGWHLAQRVMLVGEVRFPGRYTLTKLDERLTDLIARAGGLTARADPDGIRFFRKDGDLGRIDLNYAAATRDPNSRANFVLVAGDSIAVPKYAPIVKVSGAVGAPSTVAYVPGKDANYYIEQAGGLLWTGERSRIYVTQPNGARELYRQHRLLPDRVPTPLAGAEIRVPSKPESGPGNSAEVWRAAAQLMAGLVTVIIVGIRR